MELLFQRFINYKKHSFTTLLILLLSEKKVFDCLIFLYVCYKPVPVIF
jgi:hypothetical protein